MCSTTHFLPDVSQVFRRCCADKGGMDALVSQSVIPRRKSFGGAAPYAFTEQGVAMHSSVLRSPCNQHNSNRNAVVADVAHGQERGKVAPASRFMISF